MTATAHSVATADNLPHWNRCVQSFGGSRATSPSLAIRAGASLIRADYSPTLFARSPLSGPDRTPHTAGGPAGRHQDGRTTGGRAPIALGGMGHDLLSFCPVVLLSKRAPESQSGTGASPTLSTSSIASTVSKRPLAGGGPPRTAAGRLASGASRLARRQPPDARRQTKTARPAHGSPRAGRLPEIGRRVTA